MYYKSDISSKMRFNSIAAIYEAGRPVYPAEIFKDILMTMERGDGQDGKRLDRILEIGSGTGQIVLNLCGMADNVDCVEPGNNLMSILIAKFGSNPQIGLHECEFEEFDSPYKYDLVVSANALHWIPKEIAFPKIRLLLKGKGWVVGMWGQSVFHDDIYSVVTETFGKQFSDFCDSRYSDSHESYFEEGFADFSENWGFSNCNMKKYSSERISTSQEIVHFIWSYTDVVGLSQETQENLIGALRRRIDNMEMGRHKCIDYFLVAMGQYI